MTSCTIVTNVAMTTMNAGIRTLSGMRFLRSEITTFEQTSTKSVAKPMDIPLTALVVVASVGHIPRTNAKVGFSLRIPLVNVFIALLIIIPPFLRVVLQLLQRVALLPVLHLAAGLRRKLPQQPLQQQLRTLC